MSDILLFYIGPLLFCVFGFLLSRQLIHEEDRDHKESLPFFLPKRPYIQPILWIIFGVLSVTPIINFYAMFLAAFGWIGYSIEVLPKWSIWDSLKELIERFNDKVNGTNRSS